MVKQLRVSAREALGEGLREVTSFLLAALLMIPAAVIHLVDRLLMKRIKRRGGLD